MSKAQELADRIGIHRTEFVISDVWEAADELRRLEAENASLVAKVEALVNNTKAQAKMLNEYVDANKELLEALNPFIDFPTDTLDDLEQNPSQPFTMTVLGTFMSNARAAIAKATGEA